MDRFCRGPTRPMAEYLYSPSLIPGAKTAELHVQLRSTGRILDGSHIVLGGSEIIQVDCSVFSIVPNPHFKNWQLKFQLWPRDVAIRRNLATSSWTDFEALVAAREVEIFDRDGAQISNNEFLTILNQLQLPNAGSTRWAVIAADDGEIKLQLQSLPGSVTLLNSKPLLRK